MLKRALALEIIRSSNPNNTFHLVFFAQDGIRHEVESACLASNVHKSPMDIITKLIWLSRKFVFVCIQTKNVRKFLYWSIGFPHENLKIIIKL